MLGFFRRKKRRSVPAAVIDHCVEAHYIGQKKRQTSQNLSGLLEREHLLAEEAGCWKTIQETLLPKMGAYPFDLLEQKPMRERFAHVKRDAEAGLFDCIGKEDKQTLVRLSQYGFMVSHFAEGMRESGEGEALFRLFEKARRSRLLAYHLFQLSHRLEEEMRGCMEAGFREMVCLWAMQEGCLLEYAEEKMKKMSKSRLEKWLATRDLKAFLARLSSELASIMHRELIGSIQKMEAVLKDQQQQSEPLDFEKEVGLDRLSHSLRGLQIMASSLNERDVKKRFLAFLNI